MTKNFLLRAALIAAVCTLSTACKSTRSAARGADDASTAKTSETIGADTSAPFPPGDAPTDAELDFTRHMVEKGDTFYAIARKYGASVKDVIAANPGLEPTALSIGQEILVPVAK